MLPLQCGTLQVPLTTADVFSSTETAFLFQGKIQTRLPASREKRLCEGTLKTTSRYLCTNSCFFVPISSTAITPILQKAKSWVKLPDYTHGHNDAVWQVSTASSSCAACFYHQPLCSSRWLCTHGLDNNIKGLCVCNHNSLLTTTETCPPPTQANAWQKRITHALSPA